MSDIGQIAGTYVGMLLVIGGLAFVACRLGRLVRTRHNTESSLSHLTTLALSPQCSVAVVRTAQEELILGLTAQHVTMLSKTALTPAASPPQHAQRPVSLCKQKSRRILAKPRHLFPHCQYFALPKPPR
jgi:flagellar biogenesis protein FliO